MILTTVKIKIKSVLFLTEFDWSVHPQQHIVTLDVPVDDLVGMKKLQSLEDLDAEME